MLGQTYWSLLFCYVSKRTDRNLEHQVTFTWGIGHSDLYIRLTVDTDLGINDELVKYCLLFDKSIKKKHTFNNFKSVLNKSLLCFSDIQGDLDWWP